MAFHKLTSGANPIPAWNLLLTLAEEKLSYLGIWEEPGGKRMTGRKFGQADWDKWDRKWEGIAANAKSIRLVSSKLSENIRRSPRGPIALPQLRESEEEHAKSYGADGRLQSIAGQLLEQAAEMEQFCEMRRQWIKRMPKKDRRDAIEKERLGLLMCFVESRTKRPHIPQIAALLNAVRGTTGAANEVTEDYLRKLSKRLSVFPLIEQLYPDRQIRKITTKK